MKRLLERLRTTYRERIGITPDEKRALAVLVLLALIGLAAWVLL
jgi:hypothetical protein